MVQSEGRIYLVSTPIGNLEDMTLRALRMLGEADLIYAEDTRKSRKLLTHFNISKPLRSYHIKNEHFKTDEILNNAKLGKIIAVVSDAGTPCVSDPGFLLVREAIAENVHLEVIPGVSALTYSVAASGLPVDKFAFYGFLPGKKGKRQNIFRKIIDSGMTGVIFESPFRISKTLRLASDFFSPKSQFAIIREATKIHEEIIKMDFAEIDEIFLARKWKGEIVLMIYPEKIK